jgi:hypothetical protein
LKYSVGRFHFVGAVLLAILSVGLLTGRCFGQDSQVWTLTDAGLRQQAVLVTALDGDGAQVRDASGTGPVHLAAWDDLVMLSRGGAAPPAFGGKMTAGLWSGDRITGSPVSFSGETLVWTNPWFGNLKIGLSQLAYVIRVIRPDANQLADVPGLDDIRQQDIVQLANGDTAAGIVTSLDGTSVSVQSTGDPVPVPLDSVRAILMTTPHRKSGQEKRGVRVTVDDGSIVTASSVKLTDGTLAMTRSDGQILSVAFKSVTSIEQVNGPISWLSERVPSEDIQTPFWGGDPRWPTRVGAAVDGRPLVFAGRAYPHGIGVHAYSRLSYALDSTYVALRTGYAITGDSPLADLTVRIKLDGKTVYESGHVRSTVLADPIVVDVRGARILSLEVDYGPAGDVQGRLAWLDPVLMKSMPGKSVNGAEPATTRSSGQSMEILTAPAGVVPDAAAPMAPPGIVLQPDEGAK